MTIQPIRNLLYELPWWLIAVIAIGGVAAYQAITNETYHLIVMTVSEGIGVTLFVTVTAFALATVLGLLVALALQSRNVVLRHAARFYCEVIRGIPVLVLLFYIAFVAAPLIVGAANAVLTAVGLKTDLEVRDFSLMYRAIFALTISYSAFLAEVFRAGLQAVDQGQIEAARALGMSRWLVFRFVAFPLAFRTILPPLGNDFIAMIKDSALVSVLGVADITQMAKVYASGSFLFFETYNVVAAIYLLLTVGLSLALRGLERRLRAHTER